MRIRVVGGKYHKEAYDGVDEQSKLSLVRETTNAFDPNAIMVLADSNHIGYVSRDGNRKVKTNVELINNMADVEKTNVILDKKYKNYMYMEVLEMNKYSFEIGKMSDEQIRELGKQATLSILSSEAKEADLVFGGMRHQLAHKEGVKPEIGEICHLERKWRGKKNGEWVNEFHREPGDKGTVHLVSDKNGYSYGVLMQSERKLSQIKRLLGGGKYVWTNQDVRDYDYFLNPYTLYKVVDILDGVFVFVERVGPDEFQLATGRHNYEKVY